MNTKLKNVEVNPEYADLFSYKTSEEKTEHNAQMISYRILSEVEKICDEKNINKKKLAEMVGTSRSYITQLFRGSKQVNTWIMAKFEDALEISFEFKIKMDGKTEQEFIDKQLVPNIIGQRHLHSPGMVWMGFAPSSREESTKALVIKMVKEEKQNDQKHKQIG